MAEALKAGRSLELRPLRLADAEAVFALVQSNRKRLRRWLPWPDNTHNVQDSRSYIRRVRNQEKLGLAKAFGVWWKDVLVGITGFVWVDPARGCVAIGYWLGREAEGQGVMTTAVSALIRHCFRTMKFSRIEIRAGVHNRRSRAIPERLGFRHEGTIHKAEQLADREVDHAVYALMAEEWRAR